MAGYQSKFRGAEVDAYLDYVKKLQEEGLDLSDYAKKEDLNNKQDAIPDLNAIRSGAAKGATALQEHQDISHLAEKSEVERLADDVTKYGKDIAALQTVTEKQGALAQESKGRLDNLEPIVTELKEEVDNLKNGEISWTDVQ